MFSTRRHQITRPIRRNRLARKNHRTLPRHRPLRYEPLEDRTLLSVGAWIGPGATDELLQTFHNPTPETEAMFGGVVDTVGSDKLLIGVWNDTGAEYAGIVHLFDRNTEGLLQTFQDPAPDAERDDRFGHCAVAAGDQHVLISASREDAEGCDKAGAVYLFNLDGELIQTITSPTPGPYDDFGYSLAYYEGHDGVGEKVIIGEPYQDVDVEGALGAAYVYDFDSSTGTVSEPPVTLLPHKAADDYADRSGYTVAAMAEGVLVGSYFGETPEVSGPRVDVFGWNGDLKATLNHPNHGDYGSFATTIATTDDNKVIVGAEAAVHLFQLDGTPDGELLHSWFGPPAPFGRAVAAAGDDILITGAREEGAEGVDVVYLYDGTTYELLQTFTNPTPEKGDRYGGGFGVARQGLAAVDNEIIIADAWDDDAGAQNDGSVYIFEAFNQNSSDTGSIRGHVFADLNENGSHDDGVALPEVFQVYLDADGNGELDEGETVSTTRDRTGRFAFHNVPTGTYRVAQVPQPGWTLTTEPQTVLVEAGKVTTDVDFANTIRNEQVEYPAPPDQVGFRIKNDCEHWSWFSVEDSYPVLDADAMLDITHDTLKGLRAYLRVHDGTDNTAPGGVTVTLLGYGLVSGENLNGTVFDDEALVSIQDGVAPYDGTTDASDGRYRPYWPFTAFDLQDAGSTWELKLDDWAFSDHSKGRLNGWSVSLTRAIPPDGEGNSVPVVADDGGYQVTHGQVLDTLGVTSVLANDYDPDNPDGTADRPGLTAAVVDGPSNGSLLLRPDGSFRYVPYHDFVGTDTFTYKVSDVFSYSEEATVTIDVTSAPQPGITVTPTSGLVTTEAGGTDSFEVVLDTDPGEGVSVTVPVHSNDQSEGTVSPTTLEFTGGATGNWDAPQMVTVTGGDDSVDDGDQAYTIVTDPATATDDSSPYHGMDADDVSAVNLDDDETPGITVDPTSGLVTSEDGGSDTFSVVLDAQPSANVTIGVSSSDTSEGTVDPTSLTFTSTDWDTPQTVTVTGVDDGDQDGDVPYSIVTAAAVSDDSNYNGLDPADVSVTNTDNDGSAEPDVYESTDTPLDIDDAHPRWPRTTTSELEISSTDEISSLDLEISLDDGNSDVSDLSVTLTSPDNTEKTITPLESGTKTYEDVGFGGESLGGTWTLAITDSVKGNRHTLNSWSLLVVPETTSTSSSTTLLAAGSFEPRDSTETVTVTSTSTTEPSFSSNTEPEGGMSADALFPPPQLAEPSLHLLAADRMALSANHERGDDLATDQALDELLGGEEAPEALDDLVLALA